MLKRLVQWMVAAAAAGLLASCGGGGSGGDPLFGGGGGGSGAQAADLILQLNKTSVVNSGSDEAVVTVTAVDAARVAVPSIAVQIAVNNNAVAAVSGTATDNDGRLTATVGIGGDRSNRTVTVTARSGAIVRTATFSVRGAQLAAVPVPATIGAGDQGEIQFRLTDVNSDGIGNAPIVVTGPGGIQTAGTTNSSGDYVYTYTAPSSGATGPLAFRALAGGVEVAQEVQLDGGASIPDAVGPVQSASVSANPDVISISTTSQVRAIFVGANNTPIPNIRVRFDLAGDVNSIGGRVASGSSIVYSSVNGIATTSYEPGTRSSPPNGVTVRACWDYTDFPAGTCPNQATDTLTVSAEALSVTIGTDATVGIGDSELTYFKRFVVVVNDASGRAVPDVLVTPTIDLLRFYKGFWRQPLDGAVPAESGWQWEPQASCDNEDLNRNGLNEVLGGTVVEDANGSLNFTPGRPALEPRRADVTLVIEGSNRTNASGQVVMRIEYPQSVASWVNYNLVVSAAGVAGTEGFANFSGDLPVLAAEVNDVSTDVPFAFSPYGVEASPTVLRTNPENTAQSGLLCTNPR